MNRDIKNKDIKGSYGRTIKYLGIFGGAQGISMFLNLVRNKVASILLGANGLGLIALYNRTIQMFSDCTNLSLSFSAVRSLSYAYENEDEGTVEHCVKVIRSIAFLTGIVGMLLFLICSPLIANWIFGRYTYYLSRFIMLSPVVLFMAVSGGEIAILRGTRQLNKIALYSLLTAVAGVLFAVPLYYIKGLGGIFPAIFIIAFVQMVALLRFSTKRFCYRIKPFSMSLIYEGIDMVKMGAGYIYASILTSCSIWLICKALSEIGNGAVTGLFSAGYVLISMLPSVLFAALDSDYYPRLSGVFRKKGERNVMVNEQIEVHLLVQAPIILGVVVILPQLLPMLYSAEFSPAIKMTQMAMFGLLFHTLTYPISFMPLSKGDSFVFLVQESAYNIMFVVLVVLGYHQYGLRGIGVAMFLVRAIDLAVVYFISNRKYDFVLSWRVVKFFLINLLLYAIVLYTILNMSGVRAFVVAAGCVACSGLVSLYMLAKHETFLYKVYKRLFRK